MTVLGCDCDSHGDGGGSRGLTDPAHQLIHSDSHNSEIRKAHLQAQNKTTGLHCHHERREQHMMTK